MSRWTDTPTVACLAGLPFGPSLPGPLCLPSDSKLDFKLYAISHLHRRPYLPECGQRSLLTHHALQWISITQELGVEILYVHPKATFQLILIGFQRDTIFLSKLFVGQLIALRENVPWHSRLGTNTKS